MRYRMLTAAALLSLMPAMQADAEVAPSFCRSLADTVATTANNLRGLAENLGKADMKPIIDEATADLRVAAVSMQLARMKLLPALRDYIEKADDFAYQARRCSRRG